MKGTPPLLLVEADTETAIPYDLAAGTASAFSRSSPDPSHSNEDCAAILPGPAKRVILAVADGMGGHARGDVASRIAIECIAAAAQDAEHETRSAILDAFEEADRRIATEVPGSGTTLVVAAIEDGAFRTFHCGDAAALAVGGRGKLKHRTIDHSPVGYAVESGMMTPEEAIRHVERHVVSSFVGSRDMRVEISAAIRLSPRDTLVLASDGLFDNLLDSEITERVRKGRLSDASANLTEEARRRMQRTDPTKSGKPDDLTIVLFRPAK